MSELLIKEIDENVLNHLQEQAMMHGQSVEEYAKDMLISKTEGKRISKEEFIKFANEFRKKVGPQKSDSTQLIREDRDNR